MLSQYLYLSNVRILLALNHGLAAQGGWYGFSLVATDHLADWLILATALGLWFWREKRSEEEMFATYRPLPTSGPGLAVAQLERKREALRSLRKYKAIRLTRQESRAQVLVFVVAVTVAYMAARLLAMALHIDRPMAGYLPLQEGVDGAFDSLRGFYSFPSDHAALWACLPLAMFHWNRWLGAAWTILAAALIVVGVALGFNYPSDMLVGTVIGLACTGALFGVYDGRGRLYEFANELATLFEMQNSPYCYFLYFFAALLGIEFLMHFQHVFSLINDFGGQITHKFHS